MVTTYPLTYTPLTLAEAQDVIDSIFSPSPTPTDTKPQINPSPSHPGQITHLTQLSSPGTFNTIYLLHFSQQNTSPVNGSFQSYPHLVLKLAPPPSTRLLRYESTPTPLLAIEAYLLNHLSTHNSPPLPVPRVLAYDDTLTILDSPYLLTTFLPGIPLNRHRDSLSPAQLQNVDFQVGRLLRAINEVPAGGGSGGYGGTWGMVTGKPGGNSWEWVSEFIEGLLRDGEDIRILLPYGDIRRAVRVWGRFMNFNDEHLRLKTEPGDNADTNIDMQQKQNLDKDILNNPPTNPKLCILDFSDKNILVDPETCSITGIIDFERAFWGDPVAQEIFLLYGESTIGRKEIVLKGYNSWEYPQPQAHSESHSSSSGIENMKFIAKRAKRRRIRELIYTILSATTRILQLYYRQISSSDREEMVHRKRLVEALGELGKLEVEIHSL